MSSCTNLRKYTYPSNSHGYCKLRVQYIMESQYRSVCTKSMWWTQSGILFCFLCLLKTSRHLFCLNGTFECISYNAAFHLLRTYLTLNAVFGSSVRLNVLKLLGFRRSAVAPLGTIYSTANTSHDQKPQLFLPKLTTRTTQRSSHL